MRVPSRCPSPEVRVVQQQQAGRGVHGPLRASLDPLNVVTLPDGGELGRGALEARNQRFPRRLVEVLGHSGSILGDHPPDDLVPVDNGIPPGGMRERQPEDVPVLDLDRLDVLEEAGVDAVVGEQVQSVVQDDGWVRLELVEERLRRGAELEALIGDRRPRKAGEREQMRVLVRVELKRPRDRIQYLGRRIDVAALLEPRVPGDADPGELGDFLATEPRRATPPSWTESDLLGSEPLPAAAQERAQLLAAELAAVPLRQHPDGRDLGKRLRRRHHDQYCCGQRGLDR
jgi:hypothetical protein